MVRLDFWQAQIIKVLLPFILFVVMIGIAYVFYRFQEFKHPGKFRNRSLPNPLERAVSLYVQGLVGLTTYVVMVGFSPFRCCRQIDGVYSLVASSNLDCYDDFWFSNLFIAILGLGEIALIPLVLFLIFRAQKHSIHDNKFVWKFGMLTDNYVEQFYYWELVVLLKKLIFVMIVDLSNDFDKHIRVFMAEIVLIGSIFVEYIFQPRKQESRMLHVG
jgi:hypothetical protein